MGTRAAQVIAEAPMSDSHALLRSAIRLIAEKTAPDPAYAEALQGSPYQTMQGDPDLSDGQRAVLRQTLTEEVLGRLEKVGPKVPDPSMVRSSGPWSDEGSNRGERDGPDASLADGFSAALSRIAALAMFDDDLAAALGADSRTWVQHCGALRPAETATLEQQPVGDWAPLCLAMAFRSRPRGVLREGIKKLARKARLDGELASCAARSSTSRSRRGFDEFEQG